MDWREEDGVLHANGYCLVAIDGCHAVVAPLREKASYTRRTSNRAWGGPRA
jgi:hypothetical protein